MENSLNFRWDAASVEAIEDFERAWDALKAECCDSGIAEYLAFLYDKKEMWVYEYTHGVFTAGMASTQRQESMNNLIKQDLVENSTAVQSH